MAQQSVPIFGLYGEEEQSSPAGLMHIETIAARSVQNDWEILPHRHTHNLQAILVQSGHVEARFETEVRKLDAPCFVSVPPSASHGFLFARDTQGYVISLSSEFLSRFADARDPLARLLFENRMGPLRPDDLERVSWLAEELLALTGMWQPDRALILALFESLLRSLVRPEGLRLSDPRLTRFRQLVERHYREHRPIRFYAGELGIAPRTLTRLCRHWLGRTPQQVLAGRLAGEAARMLRDGTVNAGQVSDALGFCDPSYFSRFFKRMTGQTPQAAMAGRITPG